ncbi:hypothetical protein CDL12_11097 [Handroanthus impetiginosus]|uniref:Transposase-associated domain-containing protein n=1 Tax=Handroanthus impetiginosus TaxID=429701 RepID=A0A2G9HFE6_9LAMI|nr:hypothetical protein CDL12_11097 [Handroanthus impetiginosus]
MDKSWIAKLHNSIEYEHGLGGFIDFAFEHRCVNDRITCPCSKCSFRKWEIWDVESKGETSNASSTHILNVRQDNIVDEDPMRNMINDAFRANRHVQMKYIFHLMKTLVKDVQSIGNYLFDEVAPYQMHVWNERKAMAMIVKLLQDAFQHTKILSSFYEAKKTITKFGLNYDKIHTCPSNCTLYWDIWRLLFWRLPKTAAK